LRDRSTTKARQIARQKHDKKGRVISLYTNMWFSMPRNGDFCFVGNPVDMALDLIVKIIALKEMKTHRHIRLISAI
tara:strand:+ start:623 stop:850 length:228 start_codon:yes stop_codon:yes gene_type:complete